MVNEIRQRRIITLPAEFVKPRITPGLKVVRHIEPERFEIPEEWEDDAFIRPFTAETAEGQAIQGWVDKDNIVRVGTDEIGNIDTKTGKFVPTPTDFWSWKAFTGSLGFVGSTLGMAALKGLQYFYKPLSYIQEYAFKPMVMAVTSPWWKRELQQPFPDDPWEFIKEMMPGGELREAYDEWDAPRYLKGALEFVPWLIIPSFGIISSALAGLGKVGLIASKLLFPYVWTERLAKAAIMAPFRGIKAIAKLITKPVMEAGEQVDTITTGIQELPARFAVKAGKVVDDVGEFRTLPDAADFSGYFDEIAKASPTRIRNNTEVELIINDLGHFRDHVNVHSRTLGTIISESWLGGRDKVIKLLGLKRIPGKDIWDSIIRNPNVKPKVVGESMVWQKVFEAPHKYNFVGPEGQKILALAKNIGELERMNLALAKKSGVNIKSWLSPDPEAQFIGRITIAQIFPEDKLADTVGVDWAGRFIFERHPRILTRGKIVAEKIRKFIDIDDALEAGFVYADPVTNMRYRIGQLYHRIHQQTIWDMAKGLGLTEGERMNVGVLNALNFWKGTKKDLAYVIKTLRSVAKLKPGEELPTPVIRKLIRVFPEVGERVKQIVKTRPALHEEAVQLAEAEMLARQLDPLVATIRGLDESLAVDPARKFIEVITKRGAYKGEIATLTKNQYRILTGAKRVTREIVEEGVTKIKRILLGGREPTPGMLTPDGKRVRWEYALDDIATEHGYKLGDEFKAAIERASEINQQLISARHELSILKPAYRDAKSRMLAIALTRRQAIKELMPLVESALGTADDKIGEVKTLFNLVRKMKGRMSFTEGTTASIPELGGRVFPDLLNADGKIVRFGRDIARDISKTLGVETAPKALRVASDMSRVMVAFKAVFDASYHMIQGMRVLGYDVAQWTKGNPSMIWLKQIKQAMKTLIDPNDIVDFRKAHAATYLKNPELPLQSHDLLVGMGIMERYARVIPTVGDNLGDLLRQTYGRTQAMFNAAGEAGRVLMIETLEKPWLAAGGTRLQLVNYASLTTGIVDMNRLGVPLSRQLIESIGLFSPNFFRTWLTSLRYLFRGDFTAKQVQADLAGMLFAMLAGYTSIAALTGQEPKLNPAPKHLGGDGAEFLSFKVDDTIIGIPGWGYSFIRMMAGLGALAEKHPESLVKFDEYHPAIRFLMGKQSPVIGAISEIVTGRDFIGRRIDEPGDWATVYFQKLLPIAVQSLLVEEHPGTGKWKAFGAELFGMRTYPQSEWDKLKDKRDELAQKEFKKGFDKLNSEEKMGLIERYPEYREFIEEATTKMMLQRGEDLDIILWGAQKEADAQYHGVMEPIARGVFTGEVPYRDYLVEMRNQRRVFRGARRVIDSIKDRWDPDMAKRAEKKRAEAPAEDIALDKYWDVANILRRTPEGFIDWDERELRLQEFLAGLTPEIAQYVLRNRDRWVRFLPPAMRLLAELEVEGRDIIDPYYDVPEGQPRLKFRHSNSTIDAWLILMGRVTTPQTVSAKNLVLELAQRRGIPLTVFPGLGVTEPAGRRVPELAVVRRAR